MRASLSASIAYASKRKLDMGKCSDVLSTRTDFETDEEFEARTLDTTIRMAELASEIEGRAGSLEEHFATMDRDKDGLMGRQDVMRLLKDSRLSFQAADVGALVSTTCTHTHTHTRMPHVHLPSRTKARPCPALSPVNHGPLAVTTDGDG